jgi:FKBP-type peptidyl-prolyl cis-trans isomerase
MKKTLFFAFSTLFLVACNSKSNKDLENEKLDKLPINSTNDKVSYSIGFNSAGELSQFADSPKYSKFFSKSAIQDGFFEGIVSKDTSKADSCDATLTEYFKTRGSFDTSKIHPAKASHCLGFLRGIEINYSLSKKGIFNNLSTDLIKKGFKDAILHKDTLIEVNEQVKIITEYFGAVIKKEGENYLAKNKLRPEVSTMENGLQIETIAEGKGVPPTLESSVSVYYTLSTTDGQVLESNMDQPEPVTFPLNRVIEGWKQGLQRMKKGGEYMLYVPYELGYGYTGQGNVRPYSALVFHIKLVDVK